MEVIWTILPILILIIIAFRSFKRLYFIAEIWNPIFLQLKQLAINDIDLMNIQILQILKLISI